MIRRLAPFAFVLVAACAEPVPGVHVAFDYTDPALSSGLSSVRYILEEPGSCADLLTFQSTNLPRSECLGPATLPDDELLMPVRIANYSKLLVAVIAVDANDEVRAAYCEQVAMPTDTDEVHLSVELAAATGTAPSPRSAQPCDLTSVTRARL